ncbi:MAG: hypothetical protein KF791_07510 [Verrucomicrobiae bacterium]|nr:hypothetical protein [Verrucomicrobiae bacterium]
MKFVSRHPDRLVLRLDSREYDALRAALALRAHLSRRRRPISGDASTPRDVPADADAELHEALGEHRRHLGEAVEALLADPKRCAPLPRGARELTLGTEDATLLLQTLNDLRVGAWEHLGCPDFEEEDRPEVTEENFLCLWALQVTDLFLAFLLRGLQTED